jgi:hypothetical protein
MPGPFTPHHSHGHTGSLFAPVEPVSRYALANETTGRQVTDLDAHETRKRTHADATLDPSSSASHAFNFTPWPNRPNYPRSSSVKSPPPLANDQYMLAGGMDKTTGDSSRQYGVYDDYFNLENQRGTWSSPTTPYNGLQQQLQVDDIQASPNGTKPWMLNQIMSLVGGVAGKLVQFCAVPFRGFQAGGGQAYTFDGNGEIAAKLFTDQLAGSVQQPLPGHFPEDDYGVRSIDSIEAERPRMTKRLRTAESWVVVDNDGSMESRPSSSRLTERRVPNNGRSPSQIPRPVSRASTPTKRPSLIPVSRRSTYDRQSLQEASGLTTPPYGHSRAYSRQNYGPAMFENKQTKSKSPLPPESQRLINKVRREEFEEDARMRRMSMQMSAMLQEAREALGSNIEVGDN